MNLPKPRVIRCKTHPDVAWDVEVPEADPAGRIRWVKRFHEFSQAAAMDKAAQWVGGRS